MSILLFMSLETQLHISLSSEFRETVIEATQAQMQQFYMPLRRAEDNVCHPDQRGDQLPLISAIFLQRVVTATQRRIRGEDLQVRRRPGAAFDPYLHNVDHQWLRVIVLVDRYCYKTPHW